MPKMRRPARPLRILPWTIQTTPRIKTQRKEPSQPPIQPIFSPVRFMTLPHRLSFHTRACFSENVPDYSLIRQTGNEKGAAIVLLGATGCGKAGLWGIKPVS